MKIRRFPDIDLARFIALAGGPQLEAALRLYDTGGGFWSYEPVRASTADIVGAVTPLHGAVRSPTWAQLERQITAACKHSEDQVVANTEVGKVLFDEKVKRGLSAVKFQMGRLPIGSGDTVRFWSDIVLADADGPFVPFFDHRRERGIVGASRNVVFSMQNLWVRERHPDLADVRLAIVRFPSGTPQRSMKIDFHDQGDLLSFDDLDAKARLVYETWSRILKEKAAPKRKVVGGQSDFWP